MNIKPFIKNIELILKNTFILNLFIIFKLIYLNYYFRLNIFKCKKN